MPSCQRRTATPVVVLVVSDRFGFMRDWGGSYRSRSRIGFCGPLWVLDGGMVGEDFVRSTAMCRQQRFGCNGW